MAEVEMGKTYKCHYSGIQGPAMEVLASIGGCYQIGLQMPRKEDGDRGKVEYVMDSYLRTLDNNELVACPQKLKDRAAELIGHRFRDKVSGLEGMCDAVSFLLNGTEQVALQPPVKKKATELPMRYYVDSNHVEILDAKPAKDPIAKAPRVGPPTREAPR